MSAGRRVAVAVSGGGRSLANLLAREQAQTGYQVAAVVASRPDCRGAEIAREHGLPLFVGDFSPAAAAATGERLYPWLASHAVDWLALAGFLKLLPQNPAWHGRIVNIHPALLPLYGGKGMYGDRVHAAVLAAKAQVTGATVHFVGERYDEGPVLGQAQVPVHPGDDTARLAARVFAAECELYPHVLNQLVGGELGVGSLGEGQVKVMSVPAELTVDAAAAMFKAALAELISSWYGGEEQVTQAVRYSLASGGKRVRPVLCLLSCAALGGDPRRALAAALAVEMVHTYSLVHDDLPSMDDDATRRGQPTTHKKFGEATALLAGDALLTDAFAVLAGGDEGTPELARLDFVAALTSDGPGGALGGDHQRHGDHRTQRGAVVTSAVRLALVRELALAAGGSGMVLGQDLDIYWTARHEPSLAALDRIHLHKTGALLGASAAMGALVAGATPAVIANYRRFGLNLGMAFQILDDLLDDTTTTGKSPGKDKDVGKLTYLSLMSRDAAQAEAARFSAAALAILGEPQTTAGGTLRGLVHQLLERRS